MIFTNSAVSANYSVKTKQGIDRPSSSERSCRIRQLARKIEAAVTISVTPVLFASFKRESTQDSDEYNLAIWAVNLFDGLGLNI